MNQQQKMIFCRCHCTNRNGWSDEKRLDCQKKTACVEFDLLGKTSVEKLTCDLTALVEGLRKIANCEVTFNHADFATKLLNSIGETN